MIHMVLCTRRRTRCGVVFLLSHGLSQVGSRSLWSRSWQTLCRRSWTVCSVCHGSACRILSGSRWSMCQCHRSGRKSWSLLLVRSSATLVRASGDSTGGRAQIEQIVDAPVPQIWEQSVEVIRVILQIFGRHVPHVLPHSPLPHARVDSECKRWNVCCCFPAHPFYLCNCCAHLSSRFSPVPWLALRIGSNDQCDGNQC